jgi:hypothetical protein
MALLKLYNSKNKIAFSTRILMPVGEIGWHFCPIFFPDEIEHFQFHCGAAPVQKFARLRFFFRLAKTNWSKEDRFLGARSGKPKNLFLISFAHRPLRMTEGKIHSSCLNNFLDCLRSFMQHGTRGSWFGLFDYANTWAPNSPDSEQFREKGGSAVQTVRIFSQTLIFLERGGCELQYIFMPRVHVGWLLRAGRAEKPAGRLWSVTRHIFRTLNNR